MKPQFLNVDLEIKSSEKLNLVEEEFEEAGALALFSGEVESEYLTTFEVNPDRNTPDETIEAFHDLIAELSEEAKREWNEASERAFDIGYESQEPVEHPLEKKTERILEELNAVARFTTYKPTDANQAC